MTRASLALAVLAALCWSAPALAGCKPTVETDDFTGESKTIVAPKNPSDWSAKFVKTDMVRLHLPLFVMAAVELPIPAEAVIQIKLEDGKLLEIPAQKLVAPEVASYGMSIATRWPTVLDLTPEHVTALGSAKIKAINIPLMADQARVMGEESMGGYAYKFWQKATYKTSKCAAETL